MTLRGSSNTACAACKHQRRRCKPDCVLAPYFPPDQQEIFQCAHKLFGVRKILKTIEDLENHYDRAAAIRSIKFESLMREQHPILGSYALIRELEYKIMYTEHELHAVRQQLQICRQNHASSMHDDGGPSQLELAPPNNNGHSLYNESPQPHVNYGSTGIPFSSVGYMESNNGHDPANPMWNQQEQYNYNLNGCESSMANREQLIDYQQAQFPVSQEVAQGCDEDNKPFLDTIDDRQSFVDCKEPCEPSSEESMKNTNQFIEHVGEKELKRSRLLKSYQC